MICASGSKRPRRPLANPCASWKKRFAARDQRGPRNGDVAPGEPTCAPACSRQERARLCFWSGSLSSERLTEASERPTEDRERARGEAIIAHIAETDTRKEPPSKKPRYRSLWVDRSTVERRPLSEILNELRRFAIPSSSTGIITWKRDPDVRPLATVAGVDHGDDEEVRAAKSRYSG